MKKMTVWIGIFAAILLCACEKSTSIQTVAWYQSHDTEHTETIEKCDHHSSALSNTQNCTNAKKADIAKDAAKRGGIDIKPLIEKDFI